MPTININGKRIQYAAIPFTEMKCSDCKYSLGCIHKSKVKPCFKHLNHWTPPDVYLVVRGIANSDIAAQFLSSKVIECT